jgi:hypothetical protein
LQRQIEEKNKRKEDEKAKEKELLAKEEARMKVEVPYEPTVFKKKITMHNQNTVSIVGSSTAYGGQNFQETQQNPAPLSPLGQNNNFRRPGASSGPASIPSGVDVQRGAPVSNSVVNDDHEENIMFLNKNPGGMGNRQSIYNGPSINSAPSIDDSA